MEDVSFQSQFGKISGVLHKVHDGGEVVIVVHGFSSNKESSSKGTCDLLSGLGVNSLRIDLDNRGGSDLDFYNASVENYVAQVEAAVSFCVSQGFGPVSFVGSSFGGFVCLAMGMKYPDDIKRMFLRAPVLDYYKHIESKFTPEEIERYRGMGYFEYFSKKDQDYLKVDFNCIESSKNYSMYDHASEVKCPILIAQGDEADKSVDYHVAQELEGNFPNCRLVIIPGADHGLGVNHDHSKEHQLLNEFFGN